MNELTKKYEINSSVENVWKCLTDEKEIEKWGAGPVSFTPELGAEFNMWGDYLSGRVIELDKPFKLVEEWLVDGMNKPSLVTFKLSGGSESTELVLSHQNIPDILADELKAGWDEYYMGQIKNYLEKT